MVKLMSASRHLRSRFCGRSWLGLVFLGPLLLGCASPQAPEDLPRLSEVALLPLPAEVRDGGDALAFATVGGLTVPEGVEREALAPALAGFRESWPALLTDSPERAVRLVRDGALPEEAYRLRIGADGIEVSAAGVAGWRYGLTTLAQLVALVGEDGWLPAGTIADVPRFAYRGMMLDLARHYQPPAEVERLVDLLAAYKLNHLHLHLADDQGWRIEIQRWPRLAAVGGRTQVGGGAGGYLTQARYRALVAYAAARGVTIVPEVDMPGHTHAARVAYPRLGCGERDADPYTGTAVGFSTLCVGDTAVRRFVGDVVRELAALTPGPYLHLGGDESAATAPADYRAFVAMCDSLVVAAGKRMVGWDEIATAPIGSTAVVQYWRHGEHARAAVANGNRVLASPAHLAYLDMQYDSTSRIGLHWAGYLDVETGYAWDPAALVPGVGEADVLGVEAPLWTETVATRADLDYLAFPRLLGYAEVGWTPQARRGWPGYRARLAQHGRLLRGRGVEYYQAAGVDW